MDPQQSELIKQTYALAKENNRMLHAMRRGAFLGGLIRIIIWLAFIIVPAWIYYQYLSPVMNSALAAMQAAQQSGAQAQTQLLDFEKTLKDLQSKIPTLPSLTPTNTPAKAPTIN